MAAIRWIGRLGMVRLGAALLLALALPASAAFALEKLRAGEIIVEAEGGFSPHSLPRTENAPITVHGGGRITTTTGAPPPVLETIDLEFDRHGALDTTGLEVCRAAKLQARTVAQARVACPNAIVGKGFGHAIVAFPESKPISVDSPITLFNGPRVGGDDTVLAHAYTTYPVPVALIVPVVIEKIHKGVYGYRTKARIPKIAGGAGIPISGHLSIGRKWTYTGRKRSYISARCETGHLQARGTFSFKDGTVLSGTFVHACQVRRSLRWQRPR